MRQHSHNWPYWSEFLTWHITIAGLTRRDKDGTVAVPDCGGTKYWLSCVATIRVPIGWRTRKGKIQHTVMNGINLVHLHTTLVLEMSLSPTQ